MSKATFITQIAAIRTEVDTLTAAFAVTKTELDAAGDDTSCNSKLTGSSGSFRNSPGSELVDDLDNLVASLETWSGRWS